jgi:hypothetical protein
VTLLDIKGTKNKSENIEDHIEYLKKLFDILDDIKNDSEKYLRFIPHFLKPILALAPLLKPFTYDSPSFFFS